MRSGRFQARYLDPDTRRFIPAPTTFATKALPTGDLSDFQQALGWAVHEAYPQHQVRLETRPVR